MTRDFDSVPDFECFRVWWDARAGVWVSYDWRRELYSQGTTRTEALLAIDDACRLYDEYRAKHARPAGVDP